MATKSEGTLTTRNRLRRWILIAGVLAVVAFLVEEVADLQNRAVGDVLGPIFFALFVGSVLTVVVLSIYMLATKGRS
jgi:hypothetical protein